MIPKKSRSYMKVDIFVVGQRSTGKEYCTLYRGTDVPAHWQNRNGDVIQACRKLDVIVSSGGSPWSCLLQDTWPCAEKGYEIMSRGPSLPPVLHMYISHGLNRDLIQKGAAEAGPHAHASTLQT